MLNARRLDPDRAMLLVIDFQEKLLPRIDGCERMMQAARLLIRGVSIFELPVVVTEQYPKGLGSTDAALARDLEDAGAEFKEKMTFSSCGDRAVRTKLRELDREQIIVSGIETHVCVQQTTLDLLSMEYQVFVCADAVGSCRKTDYSFSLDRMLQAGAVMTTAESVLFELCGQCGTPRFKTLIELIKAPREVT